MRMRLSLQFGGLVAAVAQLALAQGANMSLPKSVEAGTAFSVQSTGSGKATLLIIGPGQALRRDVQLGETVYFPAGSLNKAGRYLAVLLEGSATQSDLFDVAPSSKPMDLAFLAKPSRLPAGLHGGITGAVYIFDAFHNLITAPTPVSFKLTNPSGAAQVRIVTARDGAAWTVMDSTAQQGIDTFVAQSGDTFSTRVVRQVPGDPCGIRISARRLGQKLQLVTDPVRDCNGNAVLDGTIVTFTENCNGTQSTVDVPVKHGIAEVQMAAISGAVISVASGVALGNQIHWEK